MPARCLLQVYMTEHLIECGLYLFKYLRSLQVRTAARAPGPWLPSIGAPPVFPPPLSSPAGPRPTSLPWHLTCQDPSASCCRRWRPPAWASFLWT